MCELHYRKQCGEAPQPVGAVGKAKGIKGLSLSSTSELLDSGAKMPTERRRLKIR